jgi:class 3 adenylate cyclase
MRLQPKIRERRLAIVLLDLIGSTRFVQKVGRVKAAKWLQYHDRLARSLIYKHGGREIDRSDGFLLSFDSVSAAVAFALAYQKTVPDKIKLGCRIGIHWDIVAEVHQHELDVIAGVKQIELEGVGKNIAARTMSVCRAGQVLLTKDAMSQVRATRDTKDAMHACVGLYKFKGVREAVELHAIGYSVESLQPPPSSDKVKRLGGPKLIKKRARDRKLWDWIKWCFWRLGILSAAAWCYLLGPFIISETGRYYLYDYLFVLYWIQDFINYLLGG